MTARLALGLLLLPLTAGCAGLPEARLASRAPDARCSTCTLSISGDCWAWPDGRVACGPCRAEAVTDPEQARALLAAARDDLARLFDITFDEGVRFEVELVDAPALQARAAELAHPTLQAFSLVTSSRGLEAVHIVALYGLPRVALRGILAHELFHAHQTASGLSPTADLALIEGAAQLAQLRVLEAQRADGWTARLLANEDPVYGAGLRRFRALAQALGDRRALAIGARERTFPPGY